MHKKSSKEKLVTCATEVADLYGVWNFLYEVVHKISRLRKFNRSCEIEFNFITAWTITMKQLDYHHEIRHTCSGCSWPDKPWQAMSHDKLDKPWASKTALIFAQGLSYGLSKSKNGVKSSLNFERSQLSPQEKIKNFEANFL